MADILLIDDDDLVRYTTRATLEISGNKVKEACSGAAGINHFQESPPDLVITEIVMPDMDGLETIRMLQKIDQETPILAISGGGRMLDGATYLNMTASLGAGSYLNKPFLKAELLQTIKELLQPA